MSEPAQPLFGTDGIRGIAGQFPLDQLTVRLFGRSLVANLSKNLGSAPRIVVGRDTHESGERIEQALTHGAMSAGAEVHLAGVITTPGVAFITRDKGFDAGVVISASHNPYRDNGIKVFSPSGRKLADEMERAIEADLAPGSSFRTDSAVAANAGVVPPAVRHEEFREAYLSFLSGEASAGLSLSGLRIGVDCANGAAYEIAPELFRRLGAYLEVIGDRPDGRNINQDCGSLHLQKLQSLVSKTELDLGVAFDGAADRALFVDSKGQIVDGDDTMLILADWLTSENRLCGDLVVATVMSNIGLELALRERGIRLARAPVGDRYVLEELLAAKGALGGEQSGHIILPGISLAGDGIITAIQLLRAVHQSNSTLTELAGRMKRYPQVLVNVRVRSKPELENIPAVRKEIDQVEVELGGRGRLLLRYSGTENLARVMIEGEDQENISRLAHGLANAIHSQIGE